ncbi:MAG: bifunctional glutamate N-acetyltransferase/amino-acid acetyltransferase ArgJ [Pseudomonadota bacterium]
MPAISPLAPPGGFPDLPVIDGVRFAAVAAGVRYTDRLDVMLAEIAPGSAIAGVFTQSATRAAPVLWCQDALAKPRDPAHGTAILVNAGNANAFTGRSGMTDVEAIAAAVGERLQIPPHHVFLASTGVIGEPLPRRRITDRIDGLAGALAPDGAAQAAQAILTTDTFAKGATATALIGGKPVTIAGFAKGSGMIAPDMATMLAYIFTDARVAPDVLQAMLADLTDRTFNAITVDSDTSTSDTLMSVATGRADAPPVEGAALPGFRSALHAVMLDLAHQLVRDGEGATKFVTVSVSGAVTDGSARVVAKAIANSPLVKTAIAGEDPNWGRVVMAIGKAGEPADRDRIAIRFGTVPVAVNGWASPDYDEAQAAAYMKNPEIEIAVDLGMGEGHAHVWTCDLTHGYISINADYRS